MPLSVGVDGKLGLRVHKIDFNKNWVHTLNYPRKKNEIFR